MVNFKIARREGFACLALALFTLAVYGRMANASWVGYDDNRYVLENPQVQSGLNWSSLKWAFTTGYADNWHPLTWISHSLDWSLHGPNAAKHHRTNVLFHVANTVLVFAFLRGFTGAFWRCAMVAALFAWHPLHVESVAWIAERKDVLSTFFFFSTLLAYLGYVRHGSKGSYALTLFFFTLALLSKPMVVTLPFVLLLLDFWPLRRISDCGLRLSDSKPGDNSVTLAPLARLAREKLPFFALSAVCCTITYLVQAAGGTTKALDASLQMRVVNALISYCRYAGKIFWPAKLAVFYPYSPSPPAWQVIGAVLAVAGVSIIAVIWLRTRPYLLFGWLFYLGTLIPVIGIVQVGDQSMADRYAYVPALGVFIAVVWGAAEVCAAWPILKEPLSTVAVAWLAGLAVVTWIQEGYWHDGKILFRHALDVTQDNAVAEYNYGCVLFAEKNLSEAMTHFQETARLNPSQYLALEGIGSCLAMAGKPAEAAEYFDRTVKLKPADWEARLKHGMTLETLGQTSGAMTEYSEAARLQTNSSKPHYLLGALLLSQNRVAEARNELIAAARLKPDLAIVHSQLAMALNSLGEIAEASRECQAALRIDPDDVITLNNLAWIRAANADPSLRNGPEAIRLAQHACALTRDEQPYLLGTLAAGYAEAGQFQEAIATAQKARELALAAGLKEVAAKNEELLKLYRANQAFHEAAPATERTKP